MEQQPTPFEALNLAIERANGLSALSRICGVSPTAAWKWLHITKRLPARFAITVEAELDIPREWLSPDYYPHEVPSNPRDAADEPGAACGPILSARAMARHGNPQPILDEKGATV